MALFGKVIHFSIDVVLVSTCLAGIKRNTGLTLKTDYLGDGPVKEYTNKLLNMGDSVFDYAVATCGSSSYFKRR
ncbi:HHR251Wp [Eremothecium sinecaudum]|uniref:HHR251Wp n=1 Tax=Eremothecium sinecaudum TaxID=45286 RepID=A0A0X8HX00_9SACH|nr:HHR251Wp [Eremothecium sinecaudum]AMD23020.1 HHR251Wp [Eremothecium sinecaudum]